MKTYNYSELLHIEADNMIYGQISTVFDVLRSNYTSLAATPMNAKKSFITASVLWVAKLSALRHFTDFLYSLGADDRIQWSQYSNWMKKIFPAKKVGAVDAGSDGVGIKPFAINEMSMMAYYKV